MIFIINKTIKIVQVEFLRNEGKKTHNINITAISQRSGRIVYRQKKNNKNKNMYIYEGKNGYVFVSLCIYVYIHVQRNERQKKEEELWEHVDLFLYNMM